MKLKLVFRYSFQKYVCVIFPRKPQITSMCLCSLTAKHLFTLSEVRLLDDAFLAIPESSPDCPRAAL